MCKVVSIVTLYPVHDKNNLLATGKYQKISMYTQHAYTLTASRYNECNYSG